MSTILNSILSHGAQAYGPGFLSAVGNINQLEAFSKTAPRNGIANLLDLDSAFNLTGGGSIAQVASTLLNAGAGTGGDKIDISSLLGSLNIPAELQADIKTPAGEPKGLPLASGAQDTPAADTNNNTPAPGTNQTRAEEGKKKDKKDKKAQPGDAPVMNDDTQMGMYAKPRATALGGAEGKELPTDVLALLEEFAGGKGAAKEGGLNTGGLDFLNLFDSSAIGSASPLAGDLGPLSGLLPGVGKNPKAVQDALIGNSVLNQLDSLLGIGGQGGLTNPVNPILGGLGFLNGLV